MISRGFLCRMGPESELLFFSKDVLYDALGVTARNLRILSLSFAG
jgi:hypothetical protein